MKIAFILGTRPNFIKAAPVLSSAREYPEIETIIIHTGQHYDSFMSEIFFLEFNFPPINYNLGVGSGDHGYQTGEMLKRLDPVLKEVKPDVVLVPGDTNSTLAGALASYKLHIKTGHIEAGMREYIWRPEEINKIVADHCSDFCFCPIPRACENLRKENISDDRIFYTGDVTYDIFVFFTSQEKYSKEITEKLGLKKGEYILLTLHRAESVDHPEVLSHILEGITMLPMPIVFPIHPRTKKRIHQFGFENKFASRNDIKIIDPVSYSEFLGLLINCKLVCTDSSGVVKESFYACKPSITIDDTTEYQEIYDYGASILAGKKRDNIISAYDTMVDKEFVYPPYSPFGDGEASKRILNILFQNI